MRATTSATIRATQAAAVGCALALPLAGCEIYRAYDTERRMCERSPGVCVDGHLAMTHVAPVMVLPDVAWQLPDLIVTNVSCTRSVDKVFLGARIANDGNAPVPSWAPDQPPVYVEVQATLDRGGPNERRLPLATIAAPAPGSSNAGSLVDIPGADPLNVRMFFEMYVNPPIPNVAPAGHVWESNIQNNVRCGLCTCNVDGCTVAQLPTCVTGP